jgi:hypothetical protein
VWWLWHDQLGESKERMSTDKRQSDAELNRLPGHQSCDPATELEQRAIWTEFETFYRGSTHNQTHGNLHLFSRCRNLARDNCEPRAKDSAAYPRGYKKICKNCLYMWRHNPTATVRAVLRGQDE